MRKLWLRYGPGWLWHIWQPPFKGLWYWEMQVGPLVFWWQHDLAHKATIGKGLRINRFKVWWDYIWWKYEVKRHWDFSPAIEWLKRTRAWIEEEWYFLWHRE